MCPNWKISHPMKKTADFTALLMNRNATPLYRLAAPVVLIMYRPVANGHGLEAMGDTTITDFMVSKGVVAAAHTAPHAPP